MSRRGPLWTRARLDRVMRLRFGTTSRGHTDTTAAAREMGVSQRTVQRWLHASSGRAVAHIPPARLKQLIGLLLPSEETRRREEQQARYALKAIEQLRLPRGRGVLPAWTKQRWTEPHLVVVLEIDEPRIRQLAAGRLSLAKTDELAKRGKILDQAVVPSRFHATALVHQVLTDLGPWRFQAGAGAVVQGYTQAWMADAPPTHLTRTAEDIG